MSINKIKNKKIKITSGFLILLILLISFNTQSIFAASDNHTVKQNVSDGVVDVPSIPQNLSATAISTSQIDLAWEASSAGDYPVAIQQNLLALFVYQKTFQNIFHPLSGLVVLRLNRDIIFNH